MSASSRRGFKATYQDTRLKQDPAALHERAAREPVELGLYAADRLRKYGVGVPLLWPTAITRFGRQMPLGMQAFQAMTRPPASCLWVAATTRTQVFASLHVEFVGGIARVCEAVDIPAGEGIGREYALTLEPVAHVLARCLDTAGFVDEVSEDLLSRVRGWFPWRWRTDGHVEHVPDTQQRNLVLHLEHAPGTPLRVTEQRREHADDVATLSDTPSRGDLQAVLQALFAGPA